MEFQHEIQFLRNMRFVSHSDIPEEGLNLGSLIEYVGKGGIFDGSKVLMIEFIRGESVKGVIINQAVEGMRLGGPCEGEKKIYLHNIPNVQGSKRVIEGVYWHDGEPDDLDAYRFEEAEDKTQTPKYKINEYYGYASWFEG